MEVRDMKINKLFIVLFLVFGINIKGSCQILLPDFGQPLTKNEYKTTLNNIFKQYQSNPDQEEKYLSALSFINQYLLEQPHMKKVIEGFKNEELDDSENNYLRTERLIDNFTRAFGLDGAFIPGLVGHFYSLPAGDYFDLHNHLNSNAVILVISGEMNSKNYEFSSVPYFSKTEVMKTKDVWLKAGEVATFGTVRDNLHEIYAGAEGVIFFVIYTEVSNMQANHKFEGGLHRSNEPTYKEYREYYEAGWEDF